MVGCGNIGEKVARIAKVIGMKILITENTPTPARLLPCGTLLKELNAELVTLEELLRHSDIVSVHTTLNPKTIHLFGPKKFQIMKKGALIINTSRGRIIDGQALLEALQSVKLGGAALDVHETEPPTDLTLVRLPNVVCTVHIGAQTKEAQEAAAVSIAKRIIDYFN